MLAIPQKILHWYDTALDRTKVSAEHRHHYRKWLRYYLDFCHKYGFDSFVSSSFGPFSEKLQEKK